ncbi:amino acid transporter AVT1D-like isoform X2 [Actinidia eriantha]|uniref:amino acid transporter AVT1D-like isoform X2 n=1 Tax=Actinidia eriantha TaxID=165200 RepID=UPI00258D64DB|nr:amino acid transporter AVT1D-like isoform X2 [Actinidia eriantha]
MEMNGDEDFGTDRRIGFETDDEKNQAGLCDGDDTDSGGTLPPSRSAAVYNNIDNTTWPSSYRESMDMYTSATPPLVCFLSNSFLTSALKRPQACVPGDSFQINEPFISSPTLDKDEVPISYLPAEKLYAASHQSRFSANELTLSQQQCSCAQSVLNGDIYIFSPHVLYMYTGQADTWVLVNFVDNLISSWVEYLIMMSDNLSTLFPNAQINVAGFPFDSYQLCTIMSTLVILPTVWLRDFSLLSYISVVDKVGFHPSGTALDLAKLPVAVGLFGFCYGSHLAFPNIYSSMKEPSRFPSVLIIRLLPVSKYAMTITPVALEPRGTLATTSV